MDVKARLLARRTKTEPVDIPGVGTVHVRSLTRREVLNLQEHRGADRERKMIALAMVDPVLTEAEAGEWMEACDSGEIEQVTVKIAKLSGLTVLTEQEAYRRFEEEDGAEFRVLPGGKAGDDGGSSA